MEEKEKIVFPKEVQREMLKFFMQTSMPRIKKAREQEKENQACSKEKEKEK